jgi:hypothetical protein
LCFLSNRLYLGPYFLPSDFGAHRRSSFPTRHVA